MEKVLQIVERIHEYLKRFVRERFSGKVIFTLHWRDGGVGRVEVEIKHDL